MGEWGVTMRQSDYGLDLLDLIIDKQLRKIDFNCFHVLEAIELLRLKILDEIKKENRGGTQEELDFYIELNFQRDFEQAVLLVAECLTDYYEHGELVVHDFSQKNEGQSERHIREFIVTDEDLRLLLTEARNALSPESELRKSWEESEHFEEWQAYVNVICRILEQHSGT